uniref:Ribosomal protein S19 n=1 Tax=Synura synuroidea TaxID=47573 RepID=Q9MG95_9STRA|nr:ribosomal protein S19 [Synura synuroidea]AAF36954.1 ribosomal protein S19 [Synura synuroidea]
MSRSKWKGKYIPRFLLKKNFILTKKNKIWSRNSAIPFFLLNKDVFVHNGNSFKKLNISREKIGYKFGEFVFTKTTPKKFQQKNKKIIKSTKK